MRYKGLFRKINNLFGNFTTHDGVIVLTYHRVNDKLPKGSLVVHPKDFKRQMRFLNFYRRQFRVISAHEMISELGQSRKGDCFAPTKSGLAMTHKPCTRIVITFDDGYRDNYIHAYPVLKKYRFPAVVFLISDYIGTGYKKERYKEALWKRDYLNWDEIKEMISGGISFGAHTATHPHLTQISAQEAEKEIRKSCESVKSPYFCYPYGDYNENIKKIVKDTGFTCAFTVKPGINYNAQDLFEIKRIDVLGQDNFSSFKYKLTDKYGDTVNK